MTNSVYRTAQGKMIDMGALTLQNETIRAVGNMNVNARGDRIDGAGEVIDKRSSQIQRQYQRQSNVVNDPVCTSSVAARKARIQPDIQPTEPEVAPIPVVEAAPTPVVAAPVDVAVDPAVAPAGGLAGALAKAKNKKSQQEDV